MASFRCAMRASLLVRSACALAASARASLSSACAVMRAARSATIIAWALARSEGSDSEAAVTTRWNHTYPCRQARSSSDRGWTPSCLGMTPVDPRQKIAELGRRDRHRAVGCARPQKAAPFQPLREQVSLGVEFSLIMGAENSLVGALPGVPGRAPELPAFPSSPTMPADEVSDGGGDGGPAGRIDDDLGPSPPGIIGHGDRTPHGA